MHLLPVYPHRSAIITAKQDLYLPFCLASQSTEGVGGGLFVIANDVPKRDNAALRLVPFPRQCISLRGDNGIAFFGFDIRLTATIGEEILLQIVREKRPQHQPFCDIFSVNCMNRSIVLRMCYLQHKKAEQNKP